MCARLGITRGPCPAPAPGRCLCPPWALGSSVHSGLFFRSSTPRQLLGRLQNPHDVRWELLQHARSQARAVPGTSYNRSCQLPGQAACGAARSTLPALLPARGTHHGRQSSCRCLRPPSSAPRGAGV